ncbi:unnamed protein product [Cylicocyclus nassatus]|uniref:Reverse transcriptase domain-containing protein n=1 Tax=Cylicocyclus nassatus TaxID=53992 RepID=A0AA36GT99_CYLNA|nr:unnamed protein product [Cylicocyclus nassatus]
MAYADDIKVFASYSDEDKVEVTDALSACLQKILSWADLNCIDVNLRKSVCLTITKRQVQENTLKGSGSAKFEEVWIHCLGHAVYGTLSNICTICRPESWNRVTIVWLWIMRPFSVHERSMILLYLFPIWHSTKDIAL